MGASALIVSLAGLRYTHRVDLRQSKADKPTVSIDLAHTDTEGWYRIVVTVRNRTDAVWLLETISAPHWESAKLGLENDLTERLMPDGTPDRALATFEPVRLNARVQPATEGLPGQTTIHLLLSVERGLTQSIAFELRMRSLAEMRRSTLIVQRVTAI